MPLFGKLGPTAHRLMPDNREVCDATEVLGNSDRLVHVEHHMPPAAWDEHGLSRPL